MIYQLTASALAVMGLVVWGVCASAVDATNHCQTVNMDKAACVVALSM